jgi:hypothetical protein
MKRQREIAETVEYGLVFEDLFHLSDWFSDCFLVPGWLVYEFDMSDIISIRILY